jgi:hypothetical protein
MKIRIRGHVEDPGIYGRMILRWILREGIDFVCFSIGIMGGLL